MGTDKVADLALAMFIIKMLWDGIRQFLNEKHVDLKENTRAVIIATHEIKSINEKLDNLAKLPKDVQNLSAKIKVLEARLDL